MTSYTLAAGDKGLWEKTAAANVVDTVSFPGRGFDPDQTVTVVNVSGASAIYFTLDGTAPTVGGQNCYWVPASAGSTVEATSNRASVTLKVIAAAATVYSVMGEL